MHLFVVVFWWFDTKRIDCYEKTDQFQITMFNLGDHYMLQIVFVIAFVGGTIDIDVLVRY